MSYKAYLRVKKTIPYYNFIRKFAFPTLYEIIFAMLLVDAVGCTLIYNLHFISLGNLGVGVTTGLFVFAVPSIVSDLMIHALALRKDPLFNLRRCFALSLFSSIIWIVVMIIGTLANFGFLNGALYLGMFLVAPLRAIAIFSMSSANTVSKLFSAAFEPFLCLISASFILRLSTFESVLMFVASTLISFSYAALIISYLEKQGFKKLGTSPLQLFRGFLLDWLDGNCELLEGQLEKISSEQGLNTTILGFRQKGTENATGILVVSNFHPGPFLNVGSSVLPQMIQEALTGEKSVVAVPHGISGHEMNLVSQQENKKVIKDITRLASFSKYRSDATRILRVNSGNATASCQALGDCSLVTITLSPNDMEDIPLKIGVELSSTGRKFSKEVALVDAHNSISHAKALDERDQRDILASANEALEKAAKEPRFSFRFGAAKIDLNEFTPEQGIGPGGLVAIVVEVADQLSGYLVVDGNNMKTGLRERILQTMKELSIEAGEVMTTDTHVVNGIVSAKLGYHPVGEAVDESILMRKVITVFSEAKKNLEDGETSCVSFQTRVRALGLGLFKNMTEFIYRTSKLVALSMIPTMLIAVLVFILMLIRP